MHGFSANGAKLGRVGMYASEREGSEKGQDMVRAWGRGRWPVGTWGVSRHGRGENGHEQREKGHGVRVGYSMQVGLGLGFFNPSK